MSIVGEIIDLSTSLSNTYSTSNLPKFLKDIMYNRQIKKIKKLISKIPNDIITFDSLFDFTRNVYESRYDFKLEYGGNFVRNFMGAFVLIGLFSAIFTKKNWRDLSLVGSFTIGYLFVVSLSGFANSERFLVLGLPGLLIMAAYGISELTRKSYKWVKIWYVIVVLMQIGWAYFKIGSRGML